MFTQRAHACRNARRAALRRGLRAAGPVVPGRSPGLHGQRREVAHRRHRCRGRRPLALPRRRAAGRGHTRPPAGLPGSCAKRGRRCLRDLYLWLDRTPQGRAGAAPRCRQLPAQHEARAGADGRGPPRRRHDAVVRYRGAGTAIAAVCRCHGGARQPRRGCRRPGTAQPGRGQQGHGNAGHALELAPADRRRMAGRERIQGPGGR